MTYYATEWRAAGACLSADPELFFPFAEGSAADRQTGTALRVCAGCTVRQECLDFAMASGEAHGIWGAAARSARHARRGRTRAPADGARRQVMFAGSRVAVPT
jgi:WhiB family redox-sensing transcriptional regulator